MSEDNEKYIAALPEGLRENESLVNAGSTSGLAEMYTNLEQKMGSALFSPGEGADEEQMNSFYGKVNDLAPGLTRIPSGEDEKGWNSLYEKLGRPGDMKDYEAPEVKDNDGNVIDQSAFMDDFREQAHGLGLNSKQFGGLISWFGGRTAAQQQGAADARGTVMTELKGEWGDATDARIGRVQKLIEEQGGEDAAAAFGEIGNNPVVLKMLDKIAESLMEEGSLGRQTGTMDNDTRTEIENEIATLKNNEAYLDRKNHEHDSTVKRVETLYKKLGEYKKEAA